LNPFKIQAIFKSEFGSKIYNSKSREILELDHKGKLFSLNLSISMPNLENFGQQEGCALYCQAWFLEVNWKIIWKRLECWKGAIGVSPRQQHSPATF
jgi:hypothetical protein